MINRETEMEICMKEQGFFITLEDEIYFDLFDMMKIYDIIEEEDNE